MRTVENLMWAMDNQVDEEMLFHFANEARRSIQVHTLRAMLKLKMRPKPKTLREFVFGEYNVLTRTI